MADIKKLLRRHRLSLEILAIVAMAEFVVMRLLNQLAPHISILQTDLVDAISLLLISAPLIIWRSRAVHGRETQNLSNALQSSSHAVLMLDKQGCIYWANEGFTRMSGYTLEESMGATPEALLDSGLTPAAASKQLWNSRARAEPCRAEVCNRRKDGQLYWGDIDLRPDFDQRGRLVGYIEICTDISALKQAQSSLQASLREAEALRQTVDAHAIVSVADQAGRILQVNDAFCAISGYSREQLIGSNHRILNSGNHAPEFWTAMWDDISQGKPWHGEICNRGSQGQLYWVDSMIAPFLGEDGRVEKYVSIRTDITARKLLEVESARQVQLLGEAQERVRLATESAGIGIWSFNPITGVQDWDAQQYRLFGLSFDPHASAQINNLWSAHLHPDDAERAEAAFRRSLEDGVPFVNQFRIIRPDGAVRHIKALGSPRRDASGRVEYIVGTNQDVTDSTLLTETMEEARDRAEEASRVKSQFMANMGHEIRTPMNAVLGLLRLLEYTAVDARQQAYISKADQASRLMLRMIDSVLDYSKLEAGRMVLSQEPFRVDAWLEELALVVAGGLGEKDLNVLFDVPVSLPTVLLGDRKRLQQVLFCLLDNAIKFTQLGEVVCQITLVQQSALNCRLGFCIRDTGIGIAPEDLHSIFADYVQLQSGSTRAYGGVGLGLSVAQRLVQRMGGTIEVQSTPGEGSRFFFALDMALPQEQASVPHPEEPTLRPHAAALVVDACPSARSLIAAQAAALHGPAQTASNCAQALDMVRSRLEGQGLPFTLVLLDWNLPDADSWQTLQQLRALYSQHQQTQPQVFVVSNNGNEAQQTRLLDREGLADGFLAKPFTHGMLRKLLRRLPVQPFEAAVAIARASRLQGMRVLVVEDNPINQRVMQEMLVSEGASVCLADNGQQGVDAVRAALPQQAFDVVLMDIQMPVMDGYQASREIRSGLGLVHLPIIAVSANVQEADRAQSLASGMNVHIGKPYDLDELVAVMRRLTAWAGDAPAPTQVVPRPEAGPAPADERPAVHAYWIRGSAQKAVPDAARLLLQGVVLHLLDSVEALAEQMGRAAAPAALLLADLATATSASLRACHAQNGASMNAVALVVLADAATEDEMQICIGAGAVDMVPLSYALDHLGALASKHINAQGALRVDPNNRVVAIDGHSAMARTQSDLSFFGSLLRAFFEELPLRRTLMRQAWEHDPGQVQHRSHALRGLAVTFGLESLAQVAWQAEQQRLPDAALWPQLDAEMQSASFHILRWLTLHPDCVLETP